MIRKIAKSLSEISGIPVYFVKSIILELRMLFIRLYSLLPLQYFKIKRVFSEDQQINFVFGCGDTSYCGWLGIDCFFSDDVDFVLDLRRKLPFKSESVGLCYSEHFIEHLWLNEMILHLGEVFRILKPDGRYRIVVPAAFRFVDRYIADDKKFFDLAFPWATRPIDAVRDIIYFSGSHKNIFDINELVYLGEQAGFTTVLESSVNNSEIDLLKIDISDPQRVAESLYVEMIKSI